MRLQLDAETDQKLNAAIKAEPHMLDELMDKYKLTDRTIDSLINVLSAKYREIANS